MEQEISFKDMMLYGLKRWYIFVLAAVIGVVGGAVWTVFQKKEIARYQSAVSICEIEVFAKYSEGNEALIVESYRINSACASEAMTASENFGLFLSDAERKSTVEALTEKNLTLQKLKDFLSNKLVIRLKTNLITVSFECENKNAEYKAGVEELLNRYAGFLLSRGCENAPAFKMMENGGEAALTVVKAENTDIIEEKGYYAKNIPFGLISGFLAGIFFVAVLFVLDPKIKSINQLSDFGFPVLAEFPEKEFDGGGLANLVAKSINKKCVLIAETDGGGLERFCAALSDTYAQSGYKVLLVDGIHKGGKFKAYLKGESFENCLEDNGKYHTVVFEDCFDVLALSPKKERFNELSGKYDKVLFMCCATEPGAVAAISEVCDAAVCILDKSVAKNRNVRSFAVELNESAQKLGAVLYGNY